MTQAIATFEPESEEYKRLKLAADLIEKETGRKCEVETIFFDIGQDWKWTTISIESGINSFPMMQALNPKEQENIVFGDHDTCVATICDLIRKYAKQ